MNHLARCLSAALSCTFAAAALSQPAPVEWAFVETSGNGMKHFVAESASAVQNGTTLFGTMVSMPQPIELAPGKLVGSISSAVRVNCRDHTSQPVAVLLWSGRMGDGKQLRQEILPQPQEWKPIATAAIEAGYRKHCR